MAGAGAGGEIRDKVESESKINKFGSATLPYKFLCL